ncbi:MAG: ABC transporter ATP-binding protein [Thermoanaerobaculia bacterium]
MAAPVLVARGLTKKIGEKTIVAGVSFEIAPGEVFGFLGPNGAGKTTTIRMLVGLIRPTTGQVTICGHDVQREFELALRNVGCIVETPDLYRFMSGRENLEHFARMRPGVGKADIARVAELAMLSHRLEDKVRTYSLGMRQRLGIAVALLSRPRLLILDEPANGLDPAGIREMRNLLRKLSSEDGLAVFVSSHLLAEVELMCDRVAIIHRGTILETALVHGLHAHAPEMEFRVDDPARALTLVSAMGLPVASDGITLSIEITEEQAPDVVTRLAADGIRIFHAQRRVRTLEERFLEATGGETV